MAEHLACEQLLGERRAVDHAERPIAAGAHLVQGARENALSGAALSAQQDRDVVGRCARDDFHHAPHRGARRFQADFRRRVCQARLEIEQASFQLAPRAGRLDHLANLRGCERLGQIVLRTTLHGLDGGVDRGVSGDHDDVQPRTLCEKLRQEIQAVLAAEPEVDESDVVR